MSKAGGSSRMCIPSQSSASSRGPVYPSHRYLACHTKLSERMQKPELPRAALLMTVGIDPVQRYS